MESDTEAASTTDEPSEQVERHLAETCRPLAAAELVVEVTSAAPRPSRP